MKHSHIKAALLTAAFMLTAALLAIPFAGAAAAEQPQTVRLETTLTPSSPQKLNGIGSVSKMFAAVAVLQLAERGQLQLDAPLTDYIPEFKMADVRYTAITPRMLLDHSAGIMGTSDHNSMLLGELDTTVHDTLLDELATQKLKAAPGAFSVYSNDSFTLAELLVERVSGMSFTQYIRDNISTPLGMTRTCTPNDDFDRAELANVYYNGGNIQLKPEYLNELGAGGIYSTADDLCRFGSLFTQAGSAVLGVEWVTEAATPQTNNPLFEQKSDSQYYYGLGWDNVSTQPFAKNGIKAVNKGGDTKTYHANLTVLPEENLSAAVLSSGGMSGTCQLMVNELLCRALEAKGTAVDTAPRPLPELSDNPPDSAATAKYEGYYMASGLLKVRFDDGKLYISTLDKRRNVTQEYLYARDGSYVSTNGDYIDQAGELLSAEGGTKGNTLLTFEEGSNGASYICMDCWEYKTALGGNQYAVPFAQKVELPVLSESVRQAWAARDGGKYYITSEKYSSSAYLEPCTTLRLPKEAGGYFTNARITDENNAVSFIELPIMYGRDLPDYRFYVKDGAEHMEMLLGGGTLKRGYVADKDIPALPGLEFSHTLSNGQCAMWYNVPDALAGRELKIALPDKTAVCAYDFADRLIYSSEAVNAPGTLHLPKRGKLVLLGSEGDTFAAAPPMAQ